MNKITLAPAPVDRLEVVANPRDIHRDLHMYIQYMQEREVKRMHRTNGLPKSDIKRLVKLLSDPRALDQVNEDGESSWLNFIDQLALLLGLVTYNTEGEYVSFSSTEPSYPDNYVIVHQRRYQEFLALSPGEQEKSIREKLIEYRPKFGGNEFYVTGVLGRLDLFDARGSATGIMPMLDIASTRRFLLDLLKHCESGVWLSTASLVQFLKRNHPHFLMPRTIGPDRWGSVPARYGNFYETKQRYRMDEKPIPDNAPDGFERVEGRYIERFLEGIPLVMRYVDVAYDPQPYLGLYPEMNRLQAFRISPRLRHALDEEFAPPRVTVQPNFEIIVEAEVYPAQVLSRLRPLTEPVSSGASGISASVEILALKKECVAATLVDHPELDVTGLLRSLTGRDLPQNVTIELQEWCGHAELFTLYTGFGLLEGDESLPLVEPFIEECISAQVRIVRSPQKLIEQLESAEMAPLWVEHTGGSLAAIPEGARTVFVAALASVPDREKAPEPVTLLSTSVVKLRFPADEVFNDFRSALLDIRCPIEANAAERTIIYSHQDQACIEEAIRALEKVYQIHITEG